MARADWQRVKVVLADALEEPPENRTAFIQRSCNGDTTLMREVEALLAQDTVLLEEVAVERAGALERDSLQRGRRVGAYEVVREIGRGGMGAVYLARRADGVFDKEVAIKLLKRGTDTDEVLRRFRDERRILARLDHPNIARLLDAGTTSDGLPFFVMEFVQGEAITDYARARNLSIRDRLALFLKVCSAVEAAHGNHVIHRDLKASNILVRPDGEPKLLDFGIAKLLDAPEDARPVTMTQQRRLTPACASPEQARGDAVTAATDVYSLGALLYELLSGLSPHRFASAQPSSEEIARVICDVEPARPSLAAAEADVRKRIRGDLDTIALTALRKEPARRYASVAALSDDIRQHLAGRPIRARKNTISYVAIRFLRRNRTRLAAAAALSVIGLALGFLLFRDANRPAATPPQLLAADVPEKATHDREAYQQFLQARALVYEFGTGAKYRESLTRAVHLLEEATHRDPNFALAYSLLAEAHLYLYQSFDSSPEHGQAASAAADAAQRLAPESHAAHFAQALYLYSVPKDLPRAETEVIAALRAMPKSIDALQLAPKIERRLGKFKDALEHAEQAIAIDPRDPALLPIPAEIYIALRRYPDADRVIDHGLAAVPPQFAAPLWRKKSAAALAQGDTKAARAALQNLPVHDQSDDYRLLQIAAFERNFTEASALADKITSPPMQKWVLLWLGLIARASGNEPAMRDAFSGARRMLETDLAAQPSDPQLLSYLALAVAGLGENDAAIQQAQGAVDHSRIARDPVNGASVAVVQANVDAWLGRSNEALEKLRALVAAPYALNYGALALDASWDALRGDPRFGQLLEQVRQPIDPIPNGSDGAEAQATNRPTNDLVAYDLFLRGQALMNDIATSTDWEGDNRRAVDLFERAVVHDPTFAVAYALLSEAQLNLYDWVDHSDGRLAQAKRALAQAERLAPSSADSYAAEGRIAAAVDDDHRAYERFGLAHRARPGDALILRELAESEETLGMWDQAIRDLEKARQLGPRISNIPNSLKAKYWGRRDYEASDRVCDEAIAEFPNGPSYYRLQKVQNSLARGDTQQARARLAELPEHFDASGVRSLYSLEIAYAERDYDRVKREFAAMPSDHFIELLRLDATFVRALVADQERDRATVESLLVPLRDKFAAMSDDKSHSSLGPRRTSRASLARIDTYLGRLDDALRESKEAVERVSTPVGKPTQELIQAEVLMRAGQKSKALEILERIARVPYGPSYGELLTARWERLREEPRFQAIVRDLRRRLDRA